ncbi:MAG: hypothetical protein ARM1_0231 [Candidatus Micrarchaeota archaeon]|nr:MAG: hypothetical protein ARM1_0231 [Candidatus Micrarchaeota archaeon]
MQKRGSKLYVLYIILMLYLSLAAELYLSQLEISDTLIDSYYSVSLLMFPLFILFILAKSKLDLKPNLKNDTIVSISLIIIFYILYTIAQGSLSILFLIYRIDTILIFISEMAVVIAAFGLRNLNTFKYAFLYIILTSPTLSYIIKPLNSSFYKVNAYITYSIVLHISSNISLVKDALYSPDLTPSFLYIAQTCIPLEIFIGILLFLLPLAYYLEGSRKDKLVWLAVFLIIPIIANIVRIAIIAYYWSIGQYNNYIAVFHEIAGPLIFYIDMALAVILISKFKLKVKALSINNIRFNSTRSLLVAILAFSTLAITYPLSFQFNNGYNAIYNNSIEYSNQSQIRFFISHIGLFLNKNISKSAYLVSNNSTAALLAYRSIADSNISDIMLAFASNKSSIVDARIFPNRSIISHTYILKNGISVESGLIDTKNGSYIFYTFGDVYIIDSSPVYVRYVILKNNTLSTCHIDNTYEIISSYIYNLIRLRPYNSTISCSAYYQASG